VNEYKNYNIFALRGDPHTSDTDVCEQLGLDPSLAGTPAINEAAIQKMQKENFNGFIKQGMSEDNAMKIAVENATQARNQVRKLMSEN